MNKKIQNIESNYDVAVEDLFNQSVKLESMEKKAGMADSEVSALRNKLILLQENAEKQEDKLAKSTLELAFACQTADSIVKRRHELENIDRRIKHQTQQTSYTQLHTQPLAKYH